MEPGASAAEIKKAFQKVSLTCHPDKAASKAAREAFSELDIDPAILGEILDFFVVSFVQLLGILVEEKQE